MSTLLITGANGFVGQHLGALLVEQGHQVVAAVRQEGLKLNYPTLRTELVGALNGQIDWRGALQDVDMVIHLAARVHVMQEQAADPLAAFRAVNTEASCRLAQQAAQQGVKRLVYVSSIKVNGEATHGQPFSASDAVNPQDPYARSKLEAEQQLFAIAANSELSVSVVRPPLVYGPGVAGNFRRLLMLASKGWPLPLGMIHNARSLVNVWNLCSLLSACALQPQAAGEIFLVSDGEDVSTPQLYRMLARNLDHAGFLLPFPATLLGMLASLAGQAPAWQRLAGSLQVDISKTTELLDWQPDVSLQIGLARTVAWYRETCLASQ